MHRGGILIGIVALWACSVVVVHHPVNAEAPAAAEPPLEEILVVGEQPGPAMWRVIKGDHTLWVLAPPAPAVSWPPLSLYRRTWFGIPRVWMSASPHRSWYYHHPNSRRTSDSFAA